MSRSPETELWLLSHPASVRMGYMGSNWSYSPAKMRISLTRFAVFASVARITSTEKTMRVQAIVLCVVALVFGTSALAVRDSAKGKDGKDDVVGSIWNYTLTKGKEKQSGTFRIYKGKVYKGDKEVGTYEQTGDEKTTITFTKWDEMNGTVALTKTKRHPPRAEGKLKKDDGSEWEMTAHWKDG